jgi:alpha-glucosidase
MTLAPEWTKGVHHDGSEVYVSNPLPEHGEEITLWLRAPAGAPVKAAFIRTEPDGEQHEEPMVLDYQDATNRWYRGSLTMHNMRMGYRFKLLTGAGAWYRHAGGMSRSEPPNYYDYKLVAGIQAPSWLAEAVFYQIFPDRFNNGDPTLDPPAGQPFTYPFARTFRTTLRNWATDSPLPFHEGGNLDFFGGDLAGIESKIGYLQDLGINALYLNPIFASSTNHKYNTRDFAQVDPHFGGNDALIRLRSALDTAGMRIILDVTTNHCGHDHPWFTAAQADPGSPTADYFTFYDGPHDYECWFGKPLLPKFNYASQALRDVMYRQDNSILKTWLREPFRADGWRVDVWNMTARQGKDDFSDEVGKEIREAVKSTNPGAYLLGESFFDATGSLQGQALDAAMNYRGFSAPLWRWLAGYDSSGTPGYNDRALLPAEVAVEQMQEYMAAIPWVIARMQFNQLGSHDTPRILSLLNGDRKLAKVAATLLMTYPGVPCIYYGDEIGMLGSEDGANRGPMPWDETRWDQDLLSHYQRLIRLRRESGALTRGGFQFLYAEGDLLAYKRGSREKSLIVVAHRGVENRKNVHIPVWPGGVKDGSRYVDILNVGNYVAEKGKLHLHSLPGRTALILRRESNDDSLSLATKP